MSDDHKLQGFVIGPIDDGVPSDGVASKFGSEDSPPQPDLTVWISSATGHDADQTAARLTGEGEKPTRAPDTTSMIYVDYSVPATLRYAETTVSYSSLREATTAWLALPNEIKKEASITTNENGGVYCGWEIYRLWGRWDS